MDEQRLLPVAACLRGDETMSGMRAHFGVSRKTGYKWLALCRRTKNTNWDHSWVVLAAVVKLPFCSRRGWRFYQPPRRPRYPHKPRSSCADMLATSRRASLVRVVFGLPLHTQESRPRPWLALEQAA